VSVQASGVARRIAARVQPQNDGWVWLMLPKRHAVDHAVTYRYLIMFFRAVHEIFHLLSLFSRLHALAGRSYVNIYDKLMGEL